MQRTLLGLCLAIAFANSNVSAIVFAEAQEQTLQSLLAEARVAQSRGDFSAAAKLYQRAVEIEPSVAELWANLGLVYHELGKSSEAIESLTKAARLNPSLFVPQLFLGIEYLGAKNAAFAVPYLERATKLNPGDSLAQLSLGKAFEMLDRADRAAEAYEKATEIAPRDGSAWLNLGTAYLQQVENDARTMTSKYRNSPYYNLRAAETLAEQGKLVLAESAYKATLASPLPPPCAHAEFGVTLLREHRVPEAREQFQFETKAEPQCGLALLGIAVTDLSDGHPDTALKEFIAIAANDQGFVQSNLSLFRGTVSGDRARSLMDLAQTQHDFGDLSNKVATFVEQAFLSDAPSGIAGSFEPELLNMSHSPSLAEADGLIATNQYAACDRALKTDLDSLTSSQQQLLAFCSFYTGDFRTTLTAAGRLNANTGTKVQGLYWESKADQELAVAALNRAGEIDPDSPRVHVLIGDEFRQKRRWSEAEAEYRRAVAIDPKSRSARLSLAIVLFTEMKTGESFQIDQSLLTEAPDNPEANLLAAEILVQENELEEAEPYLLKCRNINGDFAPRLHLLLGQVYAETGRVPAAIDEYKQGLASDENGSIHYQLGRVYLKSGNKAAAEEAFKESKRLVKRWNDRAQVAPEQMDTDASRQ
jgi:tetratricopeptide (TPR) repeat protein